MFTTVRQFLSSYPISCLGLALAIALGSISIDPFFLKVALSLGSRALSSFLMKLGLPSGLSFAIGRFARVLITEEAVSEIVGSSFHMMDPAGWEGGSSSRAPQSEPNVNRAPDPTAPAEPVAPDPDVDHPILDDNTRRAELDERAGFHLVGLSEKDKKQILDLQEILDKAIEKALLSDGYSRDELNQLSKRNEIRGFLFYPKGKLLSLRSYQKYVEEVSFGTHRSKPYRDLISAISASKLFLKRVKPLKRWELKRVF